MRKSCGHRSVEDIKTEGRTEKLSKDLQIRHVGKTYRIDGKDLEVLKDIDLKIGAGEFISIVGTSGCGKSTLMKLIAGLETPTAGEITIGDRKVEKPSVEAGMIFQEARLLPWKTVTENIGFGIHKGKGKEETKKAVSHYVEMVGLKGFENALPSQLSGGMQQRVSIARALINHPAVLILDEPFGALDALTRIHMQNEVLDIWKREKTTMILITHDIDEAIFLSDRIFIMDKGPGIIKKELKVGMSRPRGRNSEDFIRIRKEIFKEFFCDTDIELEYYI